MTFPTKIKRAVETECVPSVEILFFFPEYFVSDREVALAPGCRYEMCCSDETKGAQVGVAMIYRALKSNNEVI